MARILLDLLYPRIVQHTLHASSQEGGWLHLSFIEMSRDLLIGRSIESKLYAIEFQQAQ